LTPLQFLQEEFRSVKRALDETLRYDYGPEQGRPFYTECQNRLTAIEAAIISTQEQDFATIWERLDELTELASWMSLVERSHLGEFSWPFSDELKRIAIALLTEFDINGDPIKPLIHVVAESGGYQILCEDEVPAASTSQPFVVVAFQRSLKNHALFHSIFGHELGHAAISSATAGTAIENGVIASFIAQGPLASVAAMNAWLNDPTAPQSVKDRLAEYQRQNNGAPFAFDDDDRQSWLAELTCDLFGLIVFGPAFLAAQSAYLQPYEPDRYEIPTFNPTHPPYAIRHRMLTRAMHLLAWDLPITSQGSAHQHEAAFLSVLLNDQYVPWATVFTDANLRAAITAVQQILDPLGDVAYKPIDPAALAYLVDRLSKQLPPVHARIDADGKPLLTKVAISQTLYAGWVFWHGGNHPAEEADQQFFRINQLCDYALLQQRAINATIDAGVQ
jgi:hypothetical protein